MALRHFLTRPGGLRAARLNIIKVRGWHTFSHYCTRFFIIRLGLALVWLGLASGAFCKTIVFSSESAWFGLGFALVWLGLACGVFCKIIVFSNESAWFGLGLPWFDFGLAWFGFGLVWNCS